MNFFEFGEVDVNAGDIRLKPQRFQIGRLRLIQLAQFLEHVAHVVVGVGEVRLERERLPIMRKRTVEVAALEGDAAHQINPVVIVGV